MDPYEKDLKRHKEHYDRLFHVADSEYGIPKRCPCGGSIMNEVRRDDDYDSRPGKRYFTCVNYEGDGLHYRQPWVFSVQEEIEKLTKRVEEAEEVMKGVSTMKHQIEFLEEHVKKLTEQVDYMTDQIKDLERLSFD